MSYLPDNPTRERQPEVQQPILFPRSRVTPAAQGGSNWSNVAFWSTVIFLGGAAASLLAWGTYVGAPRSGNTEKLLQAQLAFPKLKGEAPTQPPLVANSAPVAMADPPALPPTSLPPQPQSVNAEFPSLPALPSVQTPPTPIVEPAPVPVPLKIDTPVVLTKPPPMIETPVVFPPPVPVEVKAPVVPPPPAVKIEAPAAPPLPPVPVEVVQTTQEPETPYSIYLGRANSGETPMIRTWKTLALYSLLAVAPVATPTPVHAGGQEDAAKTQKQFEELRKLLDTAVKAINDAGKGIDALKTDLGKLQEDVAALKTSKLAADVDLGRANTKIENLEKQLGNVQADVNFLKRELSKQAAAANGSSLERGALEELKKHLVSIEQAILKLRPAEPLSTPTTTPRIALSPPAPTGRVILANMYHEEMLFVINQKTYRVMPGGVLPLESPAGTIDYEVLSPTWGQRARSRTTLPANETFTLTAR